MLVRFTASLLMNGSPLCRTVTDQAFGTVGLSYNRFRTETASTKAFKQLVIGFFQSLQAMIDES